MKVLAISGWKGSGKDTLAAYLIEKYGATRVSFADPLKDMAAEEYGIDRASLDNPAQKEAPIKDMPVDPRDAYGRMIAEFLVREFRTARGVQVNKFEYQGDTFLGEGFVQLYWTPRALAILKGSSNRSVRSNYWVQKAIQKASKSEGLTVISDLRYQSELVQMREAFGVELVTLRVERFDLSPSSDPSERDLDNAQFDFKVNNRGTKEQAYAQLETFLATKIKKPEDGSPQASDNTLRLKDA